MLKRNWELISDISARVGTAVLFGWLAYRIGENVVETGRLSGLVYLFNELLVVALVAGRRFALSVDRTTTARVATIIGTLGPLLARPDARYMTFTESLVLPLSLLGLAIAVAGKLSLGRSYGTMPANRGVVRSGAYRIVRHPIYLGYLFTTSSFLMANTTAWNMFVLSFSVFFLFVRAIIEERTLTRDERYQQYCALVRWRVIPGVF